MTPDLSVGVRLEAGRTAAALARVPTHAGPVERTAALRAATLAAGRLISAFETEGGPVAGEAIPAESVSQSFFRVREVELSDQQTALHGVLVVHRGVRDLCRAPLSGADLVVELAGMRQAVLELTGTTVPDPAGSDEVRAQEPVGEEFGVDPRGSLDSEWTARWIVGHQVHVLFNICAAVAVTDAAVHLRHGELGQALVRLDDATTYVRGFPAAMIHAGTVPVEYYLAAVRPTMQPPQVATPLSGRQHRGYKIFRGAMKGLLGVLPEPYEELAAKDRDLADARDALLEADLIDAERHVTLAYSMVRLRHSIAQAPIGPDNAVGELRLMRHRRAAQYAPLIRFGDHYIAESLAAMRHR
ncbi:hypothetical protein [Nocardia panacis]|uniref:hypothetical protein n=1 Tax=Nocardia panacis TaxID=2340916 RepID=UPI0019398EA8|nr:hypothetical protein [Nocardia panacis]